MSITATTRDASTRTGIELGSRYRITSWMSGEVNAAFTRAYIPNSPTSVVNAGLSLHLPVGWFGALRARHFGESPLVEDDSARSPAYATVDARIGYRRRGHWRATLDVLNIGDVSGTTSSTPTSRA